MRGSFFARYGLMVVAICLGGVILSALLTAVTAFFDEQAITRPSEIAPAVAFATIPGGILGAVEGVLLAFPLAALLGLFGRRG